MDVKTGQVVSTDVSSEKVGDGRRLKALVKRAQGSIRVRRVLGNGAYDSNGNFNFLSGEGIRPVIKGTKNSVPGCDGSHARKKAVMKQQAFRPRTWSRIHRFGYRWRVEWTSSVIMRVFGKYITARKFVNTYDKFLLFILAHHLPRLPSETLFAHTLCAHLGAICVRTHVAPIMVSPTMWSS